MLLFLLGLIFLGTSIIVIIYNSPKNSNPIEKLLESSSYLDYGFIDKPIKSVKIKPTIEKISNEEIECPIDTGNVGHKNEQRCRTILQDIFNKKFPSVRPKWLKNPATKRNLELDMYCHDLRLAVEYDGSQHTKMTGFHKNKSELLYQIRKDQFKDKRCKDLGITLIRVPYWANQDLKGYIIRKLKEINRYPNN